MAKYGRGASKRVKSAMSRRKSGTLKSGSGRKVRSRKQAIAIGLNEAREEGAKVPAGGRSRKRTSSKRTARRTSGKRTARRTSGKRTARKRSSSRRASA